MYGKNDNMRYKIYNNCNCMTESIIVRVDKQTKAKLKKYKINMSKSIREFLKSEIAAREEEELTSLIEKSRKILSKMSDEEIVTAVRSARYGR